MRPARPQGAGWRRLHRRLGYHGSGDVFLAFSTANQAAHTTSAALRHVAYLPDDRLDPLFDAVAQATEEAILNALVAGRDMVGATATSRPPCPATGCEAGSGSEHGEGKSRARRSNLTTR